MGHDQLLILRHASYLQRCPRHLLHLFLPCPHATTFASTTCACTTWACTTCGATGVKVKVWPALTPEGIVAIWMPCGVCIWRVWPATAPGGTCTMIVWPGICTPPEGTKAMIRVIRGMFGFAKARPLSAILHCHSTTRHRCELPTKLMNSPYPNLARKQQALFSSLLDCKKFLTNFEKKIKFLFQESGFERKRGTFMRYDISWTQAPAFSFLFPDLGSSRQRRIGPQTLPQKPATWAATWQRLAFPARQPLRQSRSQR